jgi:hypothetical protein
MPRWQSPQAGWYSAGGVDSAGVLIAGSYVKHDTRG